MYADAYKWYVRDDAIYPRNFVSRPPERDTVFLQSIIKEHWMKLIIHIASLLSV